MHSCPAIYVASKLKLCLFTCECLIGAARSHLETLRCTLLNLAPLTNETFQWIDLKVSRSVGVVQHLDGSQAVLESARL